ncbi:MAG: type III pantothenate kinase [Alphaproteobacteria bacterium]
MFLVIDMGNTNGVFALFDDERMTGGPWRLATDGRRTVDEYAVWLQGVMSLKGNARLADLQGVVLSNVVPASQAALTGLARAIGASLVDVEALAGQLEIRVLVDRPEHVGADRLANAVGAKVRHGGPAIIIDFGTATTFDIVDADGNYTGGIIAPGPQRAVEALASAAARLPPVALERPDSVIGKATIPAMQSGVYWGYIGLVEGLVRRIRDEVGQPLKVIGTGGLATVFARDTDVFDIMDPDLTLAGLAAIWRRHGPAAAAGAGAEA